MGKNKRGFMLKHIQDKANNTLDYLKKMHPEVLPLKSIIKCEGSKTRLGCDKPLFVNTLMKKIRDEILYKLEFKGNEENKIMSSELQSLCFICITYVTLCYN